MPLFEVQHITVSYPCKEEVLPLFSDVSFFLEEGSIYDLVGPSGSGKSTLLRACARMLAHEEGSFFLKGTSSDDISPTLWRRHVCLVPQKAALIPGTVKDNLILPWTFKIHAHDTPPSDTSLLSLLDSAELNDIELTRDVSQLSGGQTARVALLRAFATQPSVLLLDEVDASLDDDSAHSISRLTHALVGEEVTCLRVRHRRADGFAKGTFSLAQGKLTYRSQT